MPNHLKDLTGQKFGRWTVQSRAGLTPNKISTWNCICECGKIKVVRSDLLRRGLSESCGCLARQLSSERNGKHCCSYVKTVEYMAWCSMRQRCNNPTGRDYPDYGGRGIKVCSRWDHFILFLHDMGLRPSPEHSLDRINNDGNYEPSNCRWATKSEQMSNRRSYTHGPTKHELFLATL